MNADHVFSPKCEVSCFNCGALVELRPMPVAALSDAVRGFLLMHRRCEKPVEPSKQVALFGNLTEEARIVMRDFALAGEGIDASTDEPAPEIDPPDALGQAWAVFSKRCPQATDAVKLAAELSCALQGVHPPHLFDAVAKHHPSSGVFQGLAHWARLEVAHMNHAEYPDVWLPARMSMPEVLQEWLKPKPKKGARPLSSPTASLPGAAPAKKTRRRRA